MSAHKVSPSGNPVAGARPSADEELTQMAMLNAEEPQGPYAERLA
jgi:hypothetical protein